MENVLWILFFINALLHAVDYMVKDINLETEPCSETECIRLINLEDFTTQIATVNSELGNTETYVRNKNFKHNTATEWVKL